MLGGNPVSAHAIVKPDRHGGRKDTDSRESGILRKSGWRRRSGIWRSASLLILLLDWVRREPNITLLLNTL